MRRTLVTASVVIALGVPGGARVPGAYAAPPPVTGLAWCAGSRSCLQWSRAPGAWRYRVLRGDAFGFALTRDASADSCVAGTYGRAASGATLAPAPAPGSLFWYVVTARDEAGADGPAGAGSDGPRVVDPAGGCAGACLPPESACAADADCCGEVCSGGRCVDVSDVSGGAPAHPSLRTGGYDYDHDALLADPTKADWLAEHHDWILGLQDQAPPAGTDPATGLPRVQKLSEFLYDRIKARNPGATFYQYVPMHTMLTWHRAYLEAWAAAQGHDPEDLWCHYVCDVHQSTRSTQCVDAATGQPCTASTPAGSRVTATVFRRTPGHGGTPADCATVGPIVAGTPVWLVDEHGAGAFHPAGSGTVREGNTGAASAATRAAARLKSHWHAGAYEAVCPVRPRFREAYARLAEEMNRVGAARDKWADGVLLDSFEGTLAGDVKSHLEYVREIRDAGGTTCASARAVQGDALARAVAEVEAHLRAASGKPAMDVIPNGADVDNFFRADREWYYADLYRDRFGAPPTYDSGSVEFLVTTALSSTARIPRLRELHDAMSRGTRAPATFFVNSQSNFAEGTWPVYADPYPGGCTRQAGTTAIPWRWSQFVLATHYLVNHPRAVFGYHKGSAASYGTYGAGYADSHWDPALGADLGAPAPGTSACDGTLVSTDAWGESIGGSDRFYVCRETPEYTLLARNYAHGLVLAKFPAVSGVCRHGYQRLPVRLPRTMRPVLGDGSLGPPTDTVDLGWTEGAILVDAE